MQTALDTRCCSVRWYQSFLTLTERRWTHFNEICINISWCILVVGLGDLSAADNDWSLPLLTKIIISSRKTADRDTCSGPGSLMGSVRAAHGCGKALPALQPAHVKLAEVFLHDACETKAIKNPSKTLCQPSLSTLLLPAVSFLWTKKPGSLQGFGHSHKPRIGRQAAAEDQGTSSCTYKLQVVSLSVFSLGCQTMIVPCNRSYGSATIKINLNLITAV